MHYTKGSFLCSILSILQQTGIQDEIQSSEQSSDCDVKKKEI